jgi:bifunctional UDP-N-acetylglucosamine pyrophosphorylase/glucosamine-1-phosphate N-acetyltransferase
MTATQVSAIVLAAGQGTRMKSARPKVLHEIAGRPMVHYPVRAALDAGASEVIVVVGHGREEVERSLQAAFGDLVRIAVQSEQRGTGHAVACGLPAVSSAATSLLVLYGDTPLVEASLLRGLLEAWAGRKSEAMAMVTCEVPNPAGYGRIVRGSEGQVQAIREHRDCSPEELRIREINPGLYLYDAAFLRGVLPRLRPQNAQQELYLTDTVAEAVSLGVITVSGAAANLEGVNDRSQLDDLERRLLDRIATRWRKEGVTIRQGAWIADTVQLEPDAIIEPGATLRGSTVVRRGARIDVGAVVEDSEVGPGTHVRPYSVLQRARVGSEAQIGPFSHLRPGSDVREGAHVGNFVETKNTTMHRGAKANHLAYLGDGEVGEGANVGAGTIFCNYDGFRKHRTVIGAGAFIGSDSQLVAPVTVGAGAYVGTGTTVTKDVPADALAISRTAQENKLGYASRLRARFKAAAEADKARLAEKNAENPPEAG